MWQTLCLSKSPIFSLILMITIYFIGIFLKCLSSFCLLHCTPTLSDCLKLVTPYLITFLMTPSYSCSLKMLLEPLMAPISTHSLPPIKMPCVIAMVLSQPTPWLFATSPCDFSIPRAAGKDLLLMPGCFTIFVSPISVFLMGSTSLQTQGSQPAPPYLFHIMAHNTIFLNRVVHSYGMYHLLLQLICNLYFTDPPPEKNCSI